MELRLVQPKKTGLKVYRRHTAECAVKDPEQLKKCSCPLWMYGWHDGKPIRQSMATRNLQLANRQITELEDPRATQLKPVAEAIAAYRKHIAHLEPGSQRKYANVLRFFWCYCETAELRYMADLTVDALDDYRSTRRLAPSTAAKELDILRLFFGFCLERNWTADNPAQKIKPPRNWNRPKWCPTLRRKYPA